MNTNVISPYIRTAIQSTLMAGCTLQRRTLFDYELIYILDGNCRITIEEVPYDCKKNDVVLLRPGIPHMFQCSAEQDFNQPHIHFDLEYSSASEQRSISFKDRSAMTEEEQALICKDVLADIPIPTVFQVIDIEQFRRLFFQIIMLYENKPPQYQLLGKAYLIELISILLRQFETMPSENENAKWSDLAVIKNFIDVNFLHPITLDSLSMQFHINKFTLTRKFRMYYQQSVMLYYRTKRIEYAKHLLCTTNRSISSIGAELGFNDLYSFSRNFRTFTGQSPSAFRIKNRKYEK